MHYTNYIDSPTGADTMSITITGTRPARTAKLSNGKTTKFPAYTTTFLQDDAGLWSTDGYKVREADVIESLAKCTNWAEIRPVHFPMHGFHS